MTGAGATDPSLESIQQAVDRLQGAVAQARLYGHTHPEARAALRRLQNTVHEVGEWLGALELRTSPRGFVWRGTVVREETDERAGIGRHLHIEGIATLSLDPGIDLDEIARLLEALGANLSLPRYEEETLESLLYQAELPHVSFHAVSELMDAEALSGRANDVDLSDHTAMLNQIVEMRRQPGDAGRDLGAMARGERAPIAPSEADIWRLAADGEPFEDAEAWAVRFSREGAEDADAIARMRGRLEAERESEVVARAVGILLRASVAHLDEMPPDQATELAGAAMRQLYRMGDAVGVFAAIETGNEVARRMGRLDPEMRQQIRRFLSEHVAPLRIARMLRDLDPIDPVERATVQRVLAILPEPALLAFLDGLRMDEPTDAGRRLCVLAGATVGRDMLAALGDVSRAPADRLVPLVQLVPTVVGDRLVTWVQALLRHPANQVREAAVALIDADLADEVAGDLCESLFDRTRSVRVAALDALTTLRPANATARLDRLVGGERFSGADRAVRIDLCTALARLGGIRAASRLEELLSTRLGLFGNDVAADTVYAAAMGLAEVGGPNARAALEKGARSLAGARRSACIEALAVLDDEP